MLEVIKLFILNLPSMMPTLIVIIIFWVLIGWFYAEVLGREIQEFIVASILVVIILFIMVILTNRNIQLLFFGSY
jgi:hypothetical protein